MQPCPKTAADVAISEKWEWLRIMPYFQAQLCGLEHTDNRRFHLAACLVLGLCSSVAFFRIYGYHVIVSVRTITWWKETDERS